MTTADLVSDPTGPAETATESGPTSPSQHHHAGSNHGHVHGSSQARSPIFAILGLAILSAGVIGALYILGRVPRTEQRSALFAEAAEANLSRPRVQLVTPFRRDKPSDLTLPGEIRAFQDTQIFARTDGYIERFLVDIGDRVNAGDLLAEIDTPELDQELKQAQALLAQAQANRILAASRLELAGLTLRRSQQLNSRGAETRQVLDEYTAEFKVAEATLKTAEAEIEAREASANRLAELQKFQKVVAPFNGVITERNIENGSLINASANLPLYRLEQTRQLKVYVNVPQANVMGIASGQEAEVLVRERPDRQFLGKVTRTSGAIATNSRTLLTEVVLDNKDGDLYAGMYVRVRFNDAGGRPLLVPATTLLINSLGTRVATVGSDDSIHYQDIEIGRDYGSDVEILKGLSGKERLILNPTENLVEGVKVEPTEPTARTADRTPSTPTPVSARG